MERRAVTDPGRFSLMHMSTVVGKTKDITTPRAAVDEEHGRFSIIFG